MHRRQALAAVATSVAAASLPLTRGAERADGLTTGMGLVLYCCRHRQQAARQRDANDDLFEPMHFLEHARQLGAGGIQANLAVRDARDAVDLRRKAEQYGMYIEAISSVPRKSQDVERFAAEIQTAKQCGALAVRTTILPGRRYEQFHDVDAFRQAEIRGQQALERAAPVVDRYQLPLAVENHKGQRSDERVALLERFDSPYIGACVDTGNNIALLEDAVDTATRLAPWAFSVHLKDQAMREYPDGFLLGDVPLGQGMLDLRRIVQILRQHRPEIRFTLELITRDPLRIPCLTPSYWSTMPNVPARDLAAMLRRIRQAPDDPLPSVESLSLQQRVAREDENIHTSLVFAHQSLEI